MKTKFKNKASARTLKRELPPTPHAVLLPAQYAMLEELGRQVHGVSKEIAAALGAPRKKELTFGEHSLLVLHGIRASQAFINQLLKY